MATSRTPDVIRAAMLALLQAWEPADGSGTVYRYRKAGVVLGELRPEGAEQAALFGAEQAEAPEWTEAQRRLMAAVDALNKRFGKRAVAFAAMGAPATLRKTRDGTGGAPRWEMRREHISPRYTTRIAEVARVRA